MAGSGVCRARSIQKRIAGGFLLAAIAEADLKEAGIVVHSGDAVEVDAVDVLIAEGERRAPSPPGTIDHSSRQQFHLHHDLVGSHECYAHAVTFGSMSIHTYAVDLQIASSPG